MSDRAPKQKIEPPATTAPAAEASIPPEMVEALDEDEAEFQALRRDVEGVKDAAAAGIVTIAVDKVPGKNNQFFRTCRDFKAVVPIAIQPVGLDKHFLAVAPSMVAVLAGIGISVANHTLYLTVTTRGAVSIIPVRCAGDDGEMNEYNRTKENTLLRGLDEWVRLYTDQENKCYEVFPAPAGRFGEPQFPKLKQAKIFRLAFRDRGRLIDSIEHPQYKQWAARDTG